jgi:hypothetical protein
MAYRENGELHANKTAFYLSGMFPQPVSDCLFNFFLHTCYITEIQVRIQSSQILISQCKSA